MRSKHALYLLFLAINFGCLEKNPYRDRYTGKPNSQDSGNQVADPSILSTPGSGPTGDQTSELEATRSPLGLICSSRPELTNFAAEMSAICTNGQPSQALTAALTKPFRGGTNPTLNVLKAQSNQNSTSEFLILTVLEVPIPIAVASSKRNALRTGALQGGGATITKTIIKDTPGDGTKVLGSAEIRSNFRYLIINRDTILSEQVLALDPQKNVQVSMTFLKPGAPENANAKVANSVSFMLGEGNLTKIISINRQLDNNSGQHRTAVNIVNGIGKAAMIDAIKKLVP